MDIQFYLLAGSSEGSLEKLNDSLLNGGIVNALLTHLLCSQSAGKENATATVRRDTYTSLRLTFDTAGQNANWLFTRFQQRIFIGLSLCMFCWKEKTTGLDPMRTLLVSIKMCKSCLH